MLEYRRQWIRFSGGEASSFLRGFTWGYSPLLFGPYLCNLGRDDDLLQRARGVRGKGLYGDGDKLVDVLNTWEEHMRLAAAKLGRPAELTRSELFADMDVAYAACAQKFVQPLARLYDEFLVRLSAIERS